MGRKAVGFYWTLPVPWAGFTSLPENIDEAAAASKTIKFQREAIRRHVQSQGYELIHEEVFLEIEPDRGSEIILEPLAKVEKICQAYDAVLLYVDFSDVQGWRSHAPMSEWASRASIDVEPVYPSEVTIDGQRFNPYGHFRAWREKQAEWIADKPARAEKAQGRAVALKAEGLKYPAIAKLLNAEGVASLSGKPWTADSLRKFLNG